jgi:peptide/nickel transport system permease protein
MWRYTIRRLSFLPLIVVAVSMFTFVLLRVVPGDPAVIMAGQGAQPEDIKGIREELGLERPLVVQYLDWIGGIAHGDFGKTFWSNTDVLEEVKRRFPASAEIILLSLIVGLGVGVPFGIISAVMRNSPLDYSVRLFAVLGQSIPEFFLLLLLILVPSILFNYAPPVGGYVSPLEDAWLNARMFVPPALIMGLAGAAGIMRLTRAMMLEVLRSDYVRTARAKGLGPRDVILTHAFRNTLAPLVTVVGIAFMAIFGGSVIAEQIMSINGLGRFFLQSVLARDFPVVQFLVVYTATIVVISNLVVDLSYAWIDPRVRYR